MQRQRGELVPVAEVIVDLPGPVQALRKTPPPARRGFTVANQVHQLVSASEADPESSSVSGATRLSLRSRSKSSRSRSKNTSSPFMRRHCHVQ